MKIITGYTGIKHISAADDAGLTKGIIGQGDYVLSVGSKFKATVVSATEIRIADGELVMQGRHARVGLGYDTLTIVNGTQGQKRNDLIVARYTRDAALATEAIDLVVIKGTAGTTAIDPTYNTGNIDDGDIRDFPLYRVRLNGVNLEGVDQLFTVKKTSEELEADMNAKLDELSNELAEADHKHSASDINSGTLSSDRLPTVPTSKGGTGKTTHTTNAVLTGNGANVVNNVATANGAFYATGANGAPKFGTLPIAQGGTGATTASGARANLGINTACMIKYDINGINIDSTDGNWSVDISEAGHGTIPTTWVNVTQTTSGHFWVQTAISCINSQTANRTQKVWIRDKYTGGVWSNWKEILTENSDVLTSKTGVQMVKLWERESNNVSSGAKTIDLLPANSAEYEFIEVVYESDYGGYPDSIKLPIGYNRRRNHDHTSGRMFAEGDSIKFHRDCGFNRSTGKLQIDPAFNSDGTQNDMYVIPITIYGIKGVQ